MKIKFSDIATFNAGQSPESKYYSTDSENDFPFLQGNRTFGTFFPTFDTYTSKVTKKANRGDILMSVRAPVGDLNFAPCDLCIGRGLSAISAKDGDNDFLFYALKYNIQTLIQKSTGTTFDSVNKDIINNLDMIIPNQYSDRKKASKLLRNIDNKIDNNTNVNRQLESLAKTLYDYWFLQFEFPNEEGKPYKSSGGKMVWNEELKREIPEEWEVKRIKEEAILLKDGTHNPPKRIENGIPLLTGTMFGNTFLDYVDVTYISEDDYKAIHSKYKPQCDDIVLTKIGTIGNVNILTENDIPIAIHCNSALIRMKDIYKNSFQYCLFKSNEFQRRLKAAKGQSIQEFISLDKISEIVFLKPTDDIILKYNNICDSYIKEMNILKNQNQQLSSLRDWLLPMLMNGQVTFEDKDNN